MRLYKKTILIVVVAMGLGSVSQAKTIKVSANYVPPMCADSDIERYTPSSIESPSELLFRKAICMFFRSQQDRQAESVQDVEHEENKQILSLLEKSKTGGLGGVKQTLTDYMEVILHCRQAQFHQQKFSGDSQGELTITGDNLMSVMEFCTQRDMAAASVAGIDWGLFNVVFDPAFEKIPEDPIKDEEKYEVPQKFIDGLAELINVYSNCYDSGRACSPGMHYLCGRSIQINEDVINEIAQGAVEDMLGYYFASTGPITAMLSKKKDRAQDIITRYGSKITTLVETSLALEKKLNDLKQGFMSNIKAELDIYLQKYKDSFVSIHEVDDWLKRWEVGLMTSLTGRPMKTYLDEKIEDLKGIEADLVLQQTNLQRVRDRIINLAGRKDRYQKATKLYCGVYYCEFSQALDENFVSHDEVCAGPDFSFSPLCDWSETYSLDAAGGFLEKTVDEICQEAGFDQDYIYDDFGEYLEYCFMDMADDLMSLTE